MLGRAKLFLFRHCKNHSIFAGPPDVSADLAPGQRKKSSLFQKKSLFPVDGHLPLASLLTPPEAGLDLVGVVLAYFGTANWNSILSRHDERADVAQAAAGNKS
jgi:hypothetical protein